MKTLTLGVLGSGKGSNFDAILHAIQFENLPAKIGVVISDVETAAILDIARNHNLPAIFHPPGKFKTKLEPEHEQSLVTQLQAHHVDLVVLAGYMRVLKEPMLAAFSKRIINIHPSLLPKFPGLRAWEQALHSGDTETGCTVHFVDAGVDAGPVIAQSKVPIFPDDTAATLHQRIQIAEHTLYPAVIRQFAEGKIGG